MALSIYLNSEWFLLGCRVIKKFYDMLTSPLMELLGIDEFSNIKRKDRNWVGIRDFFDTKLKELSELITAPAISNEDQLVRRCAIKIQENMERQLSQIAFFRDHLGSTATVEKMRYTPLTNSGCESRMAQLDVKVKFSGGSAPVETLSDKQVVSVNGYLLTEDFDDANNTHTLFKWARTSAQAKEANRLQD